MSSALLYATLVTSWGIFLTGPIFALARDIPEQAANIRTVTDSSEEWASTTSEQSDMLRTVVQNIQVGGVDASVYHFNTFPQVPPGIDLFDSAKVVDGKVRLVDQQSLTRGSLLIKAPIKFYNSQRKVAGVFGTSFQYQFVKLSADRPRDGFTFTLTANNTARGGFGGSLGYAFSGNSQSVAIEFDTFQNGGFVNDPNNNHIGFDAQDSIVSVVTTAGTELIDLVNGGLPVYVWIQFWPQGGALKFVIQVFVSKTPTRPEKAVLEVPADLGAILDRVKFDDLYVGFTAATGGSIGETVEISDWAFFSAALQ